MGVRAAARYPCHDHSVIICRYPFDDADAGYKPDDDGESGGDEQSDSHCQDLVATVLVRGGIVGHGGRVCRMAGMLVDCLHLLLVGASSIILFSCIAAVEQALRLGRLAVRGKRSDMMFSAIEIDRVWMKRSPEAMDGMPA